MRKIPIFCLLLFLFFAAAPKVGASSVVFSKGLVAFSESDFKKALPLLQQAYREDPQNSDHVYLLGLTFLQLNRFEEASKYLKEFLEIKPGFSDAYFPYGMSLYRQKRYEEARVWFEKAAGKNRKDPLPVFYGGLVEYHLGNTEESLSRLQNVGRMAPDTELSRASDEWIRDIQEGKMPEERGAKEEGKWSVRVAASGFYDSNVILDPDQGSIAGFQSNQGDAMAAGALDLTYLLYRTSRAKLYVMYSGYQNAYANIDFNFDGFNFGRNTWGIDYYYKISDKVRWRLPINLTLATLGKSKYVLMGSGASSLDFAWNEQWVTTLTGKVRKDEYYLNVTDDRQSRDALQPDAAFEQYFFVPGVRNMYFKVGYDFAKNFAAGNDWDYNAHRVTFIFNTPLFGKLSFLTIEEIFPLRKFVNVDSVFGVRRGDFVVNTTGMLTYAVSDHFSISGSYSFYTTRSNIPFYTYKRQVSGLTLAAQW